MGSGIMLEYGIELAPLHDEYSVTDLGKVALGKRPGILFFSEDDGHDAKIPLRIVALEDDPNETAMKYEAAQYELDAIGLPYQEIPVSPHHFLVQAMDEKRCHD